MSAFSVASLDRLAEPADLGSSSTSCPMERGGPSSGERKPSYSFYPPLYATPAQQRPPSPSLSPSPYIVNFKRRGSVKKGEVEANGTQRQNGFHMSCAGFGGDEFLAGENLPEEDGIGKSERNIEKAMKSENDSSKCTLERRFLQDIDFGLAPSGTQLAEEMPGECVGKVAGNELPKMAMVRADGNPKHQALTSCKRVFPSDARMTSSLTGEEFFDAPDAPLEDSASEGEASRENLSTPQGQEAYTKPDGQMMMQLQEEVLRHARAEDPLASLQAQWNEMVKRFSTMGLSLPPRSCEGNGAVELDPRWADLFEQFLQRLLVATLVEDAVESGAMKAEKEEELKAVVASKNSEIARLRDKLHYFELVNHEMSQRNQETIECAQRHRRRQRKRQRLALSCMGSAFCIGTMAVLAYKFFPWEQARLWATRVGSSVISPPTQHGLSMLAGENHS